MGKTNLAYSYGNLAFKEDSLRQEKRKLRKVKSINKDAVVCRLGLLGGAIAVFFMVVVVMSGYSNIEYKQMEKNARIKELKLIQDELADVKVAIASNVNVENIEKLAVNKLGMIKPAEYQIVYVSNNNENYTVKY